MNKHVFIIPGYIVVLFVFNVPPTTGLPNDPMLNIWLLYEENKNRGMSCNSLWIPTFVVYIYELRKYSH